MSRLDNRQLTTVLVALRYWQQYLLDDRPRKRDRSFSVYFGECGPLSPTEIDALCRDLNSPDDEAAAGYVLYDYDSRRLVGSEVFTDPEAAAAAAQGLPDVLVLPLQIPPADPKPTIDSHEEPDPAPCDCELPGPFCSGVPGIIARLELGWLAAGVDVERCDACQRYPSDEAALAHLCELRMAPPRIDALPAYLL